MGLIDGALLGLVFKVESNLALVLANWNYFLSTTQCFQVILKFSWLKPIWCFLKLVLLPEIQYPTALGFPIKCPLN